MHMAYVFVALFSCVYFVHNPVWYIQVLTCHNKSRYLKNTQSWSDSFSFRKILCTLNLNIFVPTQEWQRVEVQVALKIVIKQPTQFLIALMGVLTPGSAHARPSAHPPSTLVEIFRPEPEFWFILVRSPSKNLKPYNNPFWGFEQWYQEINNNNNKNFR